MRARPCRLEVKIYTGYVSHWGSEKDMDTVFNQLLLSSGTLVKKEKKL